MDPQVALWIPAIIGFVGVLVGALISTGANYLLAVRKERADAARDRASRLRDLKRAARLIANEFMLARSIARMVVEKKQLAAVKQADLPVEAWNKYREVVASDMSVNDWNVIELAALGVDNFRRFFPIDPSVDSDWLAEPRKAIVGDIEAGLKALLPYIED